MSHLYNAPGLIIIYPLLLLLITGVILQYSMYELVITKELQNLQERDYYIEVALEEAALRSISDLHYRHGTYRIEHVEQQCIYDSLEYGQDSGVVLFLVTAFEPRTKKKQRFYYTKPQGRRVCSN